MSNVVYLKTLSQGRGTTSMEAQSFKDGIIKPALTLVNLWSMNSEHLLLNTALAETDLQVVEQFNGGGALSFFQIEKATFEDVLRYLNRGDNALLKERIMAACYLDTWPAFEALAWNLRLATLIARVKYWMSPEPLPHYTDIMGQARYWKSIYNTKHGKGTVEHFVRAVEARGI